MAERLKDKAFEAVYTDAQAAYKVGLMSEAEFLEIRKTCLRDEEPSRLGCALRRPRQQADFGDLMLA